MLVAEAVDDAELGEEVVLTLRAGVGELLDGHLDGAPGAAGAGVVADHHAASCSQSRTRSTAARSSSRARGASPAAASSRASNTAA